MNMQKAFTRGASILLIPLVIGLSGCPFDSDDDSSADNGDTPPIVPTDGITGIWTGTFIKDTEGEYKEYAVSMLFGPVDETEGEGLTVGAAFAETLNIPDPVTVDETYHFLFDSGYSQLSANFTNEDLVDTCLAGEWLIGTTGGGGTFLQEFAYETGSAASPEQEQRGVICVSLEGNKLIGEASFKDFGKFNQVELTYSPENSRNIAVTDIPGDVVGTDSTVPWHLWAQTEAGTKDEGTAMQFTSNGVTGDTLSITVVEQGIDPACTGTLDIVQIPNHNLFSVGTTGDTTLSDCGDTINLKYNGLGTFVDSSDPADGSVEFLHLITSYGVPTTPIPTSAKALYNVFELDPQP